MKKLMIFIIILAAIQVIYAHESCNTNTSLVNNTCFCNQSEEKSLTLPNTSAAASLPGGYCSVSLSLETDKTSYKNGEKIEIYNKLSSKTYEFKIEYWVEMQNGTIIKSKYETANTNKKQFTPRLDESSNITIKNNITFIDCINVNNQTSNELYFFIEVEKDPNPSINLEKLYINKSKKIGLGNNLTATISAYTGNMTNLTVYSYIENITNKTEYIIINRFNKTTFNFTLDIPNNCNITTQEQPFIIESINKTIKNNITVINNCKNIANITETEEENKIINQTDESIINLASSPTTGYMAYESKGIKTKEIATYLGMIILIIITIITLLTSKNTDKIITKTTEKWSSQLEQQ